MLCQKIDPTNTQPGRTDPVGLTVFILIFFGLALLLWSHIAPDLGVDVLSGHALFVIPTIISFFGLIFCIYGKWIDSALADPTKIGILAAWALDKASPASPRPCQSFKPPAPSPALAS